MFGLSAWSVVFLGIASLSQVPSVRSLPRPRFAERRARLVVFLGCVGSFLALIAAFGFSIGSAALADVYTQRLSFRQTLADTNPFLGYLVSWSQVLLAPLAIATGLVRRSVLWVALGTLSQPRDNRWSLYPLL
jgi:hypothetical protein